MNSGLKTVLFWMVIVVSAFLLWQTVKSGSPAQAAPEISYSAFIAKVTSGQVSNVKITGNLVRGVDTTGGSFRVSVPSNKAEMLNTLQQHGVEVCFKETSEQSWLTWILNLMPLVLLAALWFFMIRQMQKRRSAGSEASSSIPGQGPNPRFGA